MTGAAQRRWFALTALACSLAVLNCRWSAFFLDASWPRRYGFPFFALRVERDADSGATFHAFDTWGLAGDVFVAAALLILLALMYNRIERAVWQIFEATISPRVWTLQCSIGELIYLSFSLGILILANVARGVFGEPHGTTVYGWPLIFARITKDESVVHTPKILVNFIVVISLAVMQLLVFRIFSGVDRPTSTVGRMAEGTLFIMLSSAAMGILICFTSL